MRKKYPIFVIILSTIVTYLPYFKNTFGIDTSTMIMDQRQMLEGYLSQGRFGIVWLYDTLIHHYNNQLVPFIAIPLLAISGIYCYFIINKYDNKSSNFVTMLFTIAFINNPVVYSQLYFKMQTLPMIIGLICILLGMHLSLSEVRSWVKILFISLLFAFSILIYQVFVFFIFAMMLFCLLIFKDKRQDILRAMLPSWLIAGVIYGLVYKLSALMIHYSTYGNETYMMWTQLGTVGGLQKVGAVVIAMLAIAYAALVILTILRYRAGAKIDGLLLVLLLGSILTFNMAFGNIKAAPRVYFGTFSVVFAGIVYSFAKKGKEFKYLSVALTIVSMILTFSLSQKANASYANDVVLMHDVVAFATQNKILTPAEKETNLVFIGQSQVGNQGIIHKLQDIFITGATRTSFFQFDPPLTSVRPYDFLKIHGHDFKIPDQELRAKAAVMYSELPDYPNHQSMTFETETKTIIVKLSN